MMNKYKFSLNEIILLENNFKRDNQITHSENYTHNVQIEVESNINDKDKCLNVFLTVKYIGGIQGNGEIKNKEVESQIKMAGLFSYIDAEKGLTIDQFSNINGPAIIFPFVREHLGNLSIKAGIKAILLPPFDFVSNSKKIKKDSDTKSTPSPQTSIDQ